MDKTKRIEVNVYVSKGKTKKMELTLMKNTPVVEAFDTNQCVVYIDGTDFIIDRTYKEITDIINSLKD